MTLQEEGRDTKGKSVVTNQTELKNEKFPSRAVGLDINASFLKEGHSSSLHMIKDWVQSISSKKSFQRH